MKKSIIYYTGLPRKKKSFCGSPSFYILELYLDSGTAEE